MNSTPANLCAYFVPRVVLSGTILCLALVGSTELISKDLSFNEVVNASRAQAITGKPLKSLLSGSRIEDNRRPVNISYTFYKSGQFDRSTTGAVITTQQSGIFTITSTGTVCLNLTPKLECMRFMKDHSGRIFIRRLATGLYDSYVTITKLGS